jgi:peptide/nickel transport system ATP-binding protein
MALLDVQNLTVVYPTRAGKFTAVRDVTFSVDPGEILGIVGESGAGKSTISTAITRLIDYPGYIESGTVDLSGTDIMALPEDDMMKVRGKRIGVIFQDPLTALNPVLTIGFQIMETVRLHLGLQGEELKARAVDLLRQVGIPDPEHRITQYPHQFSGGMRQRVVIAIALAGEPELLLADEPTTALDVSIQSEILALIKDLCVQRQLGVILITHDMAVINEVTDRVAVMLHGRMIEVDTTHNIINRPQHQYTQSLIAAVPRTDIKLERFELVHASAEAETVSTTSSMSKRLTWFDGLERAADRDTPLVEVKDLSIEFVKTKGILQRWNTYFRAVDKVSFQIKQGETFGLVGESGSGKSTVAKMIVGLERPLEGTISYNGRDITGLAGDTRLRKDCIDMQIIFQDPFSSLNPRMRVREIIAEPVIHHGMANQSDARDLAAAVLQRVGLDADAGAKYPHQFSGGQRQRICIARALVMRPRFLICDEPTSALDVSIQASLLNLLKDLQDDLGLTMLFISHDLAVIRQMCDRIAVMRYGELCEVADSETLFEHPRHEYTQELLRLMPKFSREVAA